MFGAMAQKLFGTTNDRIVKAYRKRVGAINALEPELEKLSDDDLKAKTVEFRQRLADGSDLEDLLVEAFAVVREASKRTLGQRHFDVQLIGGSVLHEGNIAEMKTGEGKTLVATLPVYLNALSGEGVHVVTVNDYLARRDSAWMGAIYQFLGLSVGVILHEMDDEQRRAAYGCDVTYATNNELGFDYLRDNMKFQRAAMVQRPFNYAIVDEVDSILVDEARTPLIISGPSEDSSELYRQVDTLIPQLTEEHYEKDEKSKTVSFTEAGTERIEELLRGAGMLEEGGLYDIENITAVHHVNQALRAHHMFARDTDYIVKDDKVIIIDEFTGRMMEGRRYSEGLHQALEAKEKVTIQAENQTLASITFQNYFRLYPKLAGMTGTAMTEAAEFADIYKLEVVEIPTNLPVARADHDDEVYRTAKEKYEAIADELADAQERGQPVLVGTTSIDKSELLSRLLKERKIRHNVLNARYHEQEAHIVAQAGRLGSVTIATNMAGRGTDIQLGGNLDMRIADEAAPIEDEARRQAKIAEITAEVEAAREKVKEAGGLYVMGTERHESRRIDNQLRGRSGRQGDPGTSKFFLSLEDDLMRIFGSERMDGMLRKLGLQEGEAIAHRWINKALEKAQQKVEARNYDIRKNLLRFDDVMNDQRKVIYEQRIELMEAEDVHDTVVDMRKDVIETLVARHIPEKAYAEQWDAEGLRVEVERIFGVNLPIPDWAKEEGIADEEIRHRLQDMADRKAAEKAANFGRDTMRMVEKSLLLQLLDQKWKEHLHHLDHLRQAVGLRAYAQRDPLNEYKREAFDLFETMLSGLRETVTQVLAHVEIRPRDEAEEAERAMRQQQAAFARMQASHPDPEDAAATDGDDPMPIAAAAGGRQAQPRRAQARPAAQPQAVSRQAAARVDKNDPATWGRVSRNAACPCGSGKKFKHCHGAVAAAGADPAAE